ncbi:hypothetical protein EVAR_45686_1 [Eumeta japonica]|uniref:Uncharacterized protein n=1 Tax=Eumeta variegata TaxID=151549 RepID=A0A4C1XI00_EUMVA|nr:hypothetical protein EVAR_45686_1 [Eumeta japonica]
MRTGIAIWNVTEIEIRKGTGPDIEAGRLFKTKDGGTRPISTPARPRAVCDLKGNIRAVELPCEELSSFCFHEVINFSQHLLPGGDRSAVV